MTANFSTTDFLRLPDLQVSHVQLLENGYFVDAIAELPPPTPCICGCPKWVSKGLRHARTNKRGQELVDAPVHGHPVMIYVLRRRFRCAECEQSRSSYLPSKHVKNEYTNRLVDYLAKRRHVPHAELAHEVGINERTIRNIMTPLFDDVEQPAPPVILGIDGVYIGRKYRTILTDIGNKQVFDLLRHREYTRLLVKELKAIAKKKTVKVVVMDFSAKFRKAIQLAFPGTPIVVDRFHFE